MTFPSSAPEDLSSCSEYQKTMHYSVGALYFQPPSITEELEPVWLISAPVKPVNWEAL